MTRSLSNLFKSGFVNYQAGEARIIDSNKIVAERLGGSALNASGGHDSSFSSEEGFREAEFEEMDEEKRKALFGGESGNIYREQPVYDGPSPEELLESARQEIEEMKASAAQEIESLRQQAFQEGQRAGYDDGFAQGRGEALKEAERAEEKAQAAIRETEALRDGLSREYEQKMEELEPMMIDELSDIYDHVFEAGLKEQREIIFHLLDTTLHRIDSGKEFIVRVSQADYDYINTHKDELLTEMPEVRMDLVADVMMKRGEGMIETGGGLFDCGIDVELQELKRRIHMLAYNRE